MIHQMRLSVVVVALGTSLFISFWITNVIQAPQRVLGAETWARTFLHGCFQALSCDPECLLQGPEASKLPKVVRRGCKRSFGPREQRSPKSLLHHLNPVLHRCNSLLHQCKRTLLPGSKTFAPLRFLAPVAGTRSRKHCQGISEFSGPRQAAGVATRTQARQGAQTQIFGSGHHPVEWGSSTWRGGVQKAWYVLRNQGNQTFWAECPGILAGIFLGVPGKFWEKCLCSIIVP